MTRLASLTRVRDIDVLHVAMSAGGRSSVTRLARISSDAFPSGSLRTPRDCSTVGASRRSDAERRCSYPGLPAAPCYDFGFAPARGPHRPEAQDVALSRPKHGFESRWGRHRICNEEPGQQLAEAASSREFPSAHAAVFDRPRSGWFGEELLQHLP